MNPHILFAEDDPDTRKMIELLLSRAGFRVSAPESAVDALTLATTERFDVVLLDNWMPEVSGIDICRKIRTYDQTTPILFCSGAVTQADKEAAASAGAQGFVGKPFDPDDLIRALRAALANPLAQDLSTS